MPLQPSLRDGGSGRAERGIGVTIRHGEEAEEIRTTGQRSGDQPELPGSNFALEHELRGNGAGIYDMTDGVTDGVTDEQFDAMASAYGRPHWGTVARHASVRIARR